MSTSLLQKIVSEELRALLARRRLSARRAALALGWTEMYMSRRMNNKIAFSLDDLDALAGLLGVPVAAFFPVSQELSAASSLPVVTPVGGTKTARSRPPTEIPCVISHNASNQLLQSVA